MPKPLFVTKMQSLICTLKYPCANTGLLSSGSCCLETTFKTLFERQMLSVTGQVFNASGIRSVAVETHEHWAPEVSKRPQLSEYKMCLWRKSRNKDTKTEDETL